MGTTASSHTTDQKEENQEDVAETVVPNEVTEKGETVVKAKGAKEREHKYAKWRQWLSRT